MPKGSSDARPQSATCIGFSWVPKMRAKITWFRLALAPNLARERKRRAVNRSASGLLNERHRLGNLLFEALLIGGIR